MSNTFTVDFIKPEQAYPLRFNVLWPHIEKLEDCGIDIDNRLDGFHLATFDGDKVISIASFFEMSSEKIDFKKQYRLRAMATDPDYRGKGAGKLVVEAALRHLKSMNIDVLWCNARQVALNFYTKLGFDMIDEWYEVPLIGAHKFMYFPLNQHI